MNSPDTRIFERITELVSLLSQAEEGISVNEIARITETAPAQTRLDIARLHRYGLSISPSVVAERFNDFDSSKDDVPLLLAGDLPASDGFGSGLLFLTMFERNLFLSDGTGQFHIKDSPMSVSFEVQERAEKIREAIRKKQCIRFRYRRAGSDRGEDIVISPHYLYFNATDSLYYCITLKDDETVSFRLDRILFDVRPDMGAYAPEDPDDPRLERLRYAWGAAFTSEEAPCHVKVRIQAGTANILNKVRADTHGRVHAKLYQDGSYYIYEDDIIGLNSFRSWLMSFGSAVKVMEPASLAAEILESSEIRLTNYGF